MKNNKDNDIGEALIKKIEDGNAKLEMSFGTIRIIIKGQSFFLSYCHPFYQKNRVYLLANQPYETAPGYLRFMISNEIGEKLYNLCQEKIKEISKKFQKLKIDSIRSLLEIK